MVSRQPAGSRARLLTAAASEFAARGFDGAKVDRIAGRAGVNKAMLYYHFRSKAGLYREILRQLFDAVGDAVAAVRRPGQAPSDQIRLFIEAVTRQALTQPHFPPIWLRELAEGGRHLDPSILSGMRRVLETLGAILAEGHAAGGFVRAHPLVTHISIVAPLLFFVASAPVRERFKHLLPGGGPAPDLAAMAAHVHAATIAMLTPPTDNASASAPTRAADTPRHATPRAKRQLPQLASTGRRRS